MTWALLSYERGVERVTAQKRAGRVSNGFPWSRFMDGDERTLFRYLLDERCETRLWHRLVGLAASKCSFFSQRGSTWGITNGHDCHQSDGK
jgi:hypothetical protein